jgi:hypothetical protein
MKQKYLVIGICICAVVLLVLGSLSNVVGYQNVKSTVNDSPFFQPSTQKAKMETQENELDSILEDIKEKISNANTKEDCKRVFKESLIKLEKHGFLGDVRADDVYTIINNSYASGNSFSVYGESSQTLFLEHAGVYFYELSKKSKDPFVEFLYHIFLFWNRDHLVHTGSYITFGKLYYCELFMYDADPAEGYIKIVSPNGETEFYNSFFGQLERIHEGSLMDPDISNVYCIGIKGFIGILIDNYYFGTVKEVDIGIDVPNQ